MMFEKKYKNEMEQVYPSQDLIDRTKAAMRAEINPDSHPLAKLNNKENIILKKSTFKRYFSTVAAACLVLVILTTTALAAWHFLGPSEVVDMAGDAALSAAFESESAININQSITSGNHIFTLLAVVSGADITDHPIYSSTGDVLINDRTYAIVAIQNTDGRPMPSPMDDDYQPFIVSPFVRGISPSTINAFTMDAGSISMVVDGIMYMITDFANVTIFADRGVYLGINTGVMMSALMDAFNFNEQTGETTANPNFDGSSAVFRLPFDVSPASSVEPEQFFDDILEAIDYSDYEPRFTAEELRAMWDADDAEVYRLRALTNAGLSAEETPYFGLWTRAELLGEIGMVTTIEAHHFEMSRDELVARVHIARVISRLDEAQIDHIGGYLEWVRGNYTEQTVAIYEELDAPQWLIDRLRLEISTSG